MITLLVPDKYYVLQPLIFFSVLRVEFDTHRTLRFLSVEKLRFDTHFKS